MDCRERRRERSQDIQIFTRNWHPRPNTASTNSPPSTAGNTTFLLSTLCDAPPPLPHSTLPARRLRPVPDHNSTDPLPYQSTRGTTRRPRLSKLLDLVAQCAQHAQSEDHRELAFVILYELTETVGDVLTAHFDVLQGLFLQALKDPRYVMARERWCCGFFTSDSDEDEKDQPLVLRAIVGWCTRFFYPRERLVGLGGR